MKRKLDHRFKLTLVLLGVVFLSLFLGVDWSAGIMHRGGTAVLKEMFTALAHIEFTAQTLRAGLFAAWQTLCYAVLSISIAVVFGMALGIVASGTIIKQRFLVTVTRGLLGFFRAIHELVWAWLFVTAMGLNPFGAIFALAIPYTGALGKVYADTLQEVNPQMIQNLATTGASKGQRLLYGYIPQAFREMLSYTLYRLECAIRSSSVLSFVGLGGLGFQIQISLRDLNYSRVWTYLLFMIALIWVVDRWGIYYRHSIQRHEHKKTTFSTVLLGVISIAAWAFVIFYDKAGLSDVFTARNAAFVLRFFQGLFGVGEAQPAFLDGSMWLQTLKLTYDTVIMSCLAIGIAFVTVFVTMYFGAKNVRDGLLTGRKGPVGKILYGIIHAFYLMTRAIPEMMWAMIFVFIFRPGIFPGALALGVHNIGVLGKLCTEVIEETDHKPIQNLTTTGASSMQLYAYGILPQIFSRVINYTFYRWEVIVRTTVVVGFVGAGGLGMAFKLAMSFFKYSEITLYMIAYLLLVFFAEGISQMVKRKIHA